MAHRSHTGTTTVLEGQLVVLSALPGPVTVQSGVLLGTTWTTVAPEGGCSPTPTVMRHSGDDLEGVVAMPAADAISGEILAIDREHFAGRQRFTSDDQRCIRKVHGMVRIDVH